jgi:hypothetical protein
MPLPSAMAIRAVRTNHWGSRASPSSCPWTFVAGQPEWLQCYRIYYTVKYYIYIRYIIMDIYIVILYIFIYITIWILCIYIYVYHIYIYVSYIYNGYNDNGSCTQSPFSYAYNIRPLPWRLFLLTVKSWTAHRIGPWVCLIRCLKTQWIIKDGIWFIYGE